MTDNELRRRIIDRYDTDDLVYLLSIDIEVFVDLVWDRVLEKRDMFEEVEDINTKET
jgi:hypothetical protein